MTVKYTERIKNHSLFEYIEEGDINEEVSS